jgi:hypothetical protein
MIAGYLATHSVIKVMALGQRLLSNAENDSVYRFGVHTSLQQQ